MVGSIRVARLKCTSKYHKFATKNVSRNLKRKTHRSPFDNFRKWERIDTHLTTSSLFEWPYRRGTRKQSTELSFWNLSEFLLHEYYSHSIENPFSKTKPRMKKSDLTPKWPRRSPIPNSETLNRICFYSTFYFRNYRTRQKNFSKNEIANKWNPKSEEEETETEFEGHSKWNDTTRAREEKLSNLTSEQRMNAELVSTYE